MGILWIQAYPDLGLGRSEFGQIQVLIRIQIRVDIWIRTDSDLGGPDPYSDPDKNRFESGQIWIWIWADPYSDLGRSVFLTLFLHWDIFERFCFFKDLLTSGALTNSRSRILILITQNFIKGTVAWDFWTLVFCMNWQYLGPRAIS